MRVTVRYTSRSPKYIKRYHISRHDQEMSIVQHTVGQMAEYRAFFFRLHKKLPVFFCAHNCICCFSRR